MKNVYPCLLSILVACSTVKYQVQNDPIVAKPSGDTVYVFVGPPELENAMLGRILRAEAETWLKNQGYVFATEMAKAHSLVILSAKQSDRDVYIPGRTFSTPVYGQPNSTVTTVKGAYGQKLGTLETAPADPLAPTGYRTEYREGFTTTVTDKAIFLNVQRREYGQTPMMLSQGVAYPEDVHNDFLGQRTEIASAVKGLLNRSALFLSGEVPPKDSRNPSCYPRLGIKFGPKKLEQGALIESFEAGSNAPKAGLRVGDVVLSIAGATVPLKGPAPIRAGAPAQVMALRNGKDLALAVDPKIFCL
jgi:hypothetical protein